jgi:hypothetical protein
MVPFDTWKYKEHLKVFFLQKKLKNIFWHLEFFEVAESNSYFVDRVCKTKCKTDVCLPGEDTRQLIQTNYAAFRNQNPKNDLLPVKEWSLNKQLIMHDSTW